MNKNTTIIAGIALLLIISAFIFTNSNSTNEQAQNVDNQNNAQVAEPVVSEDMMQEGSVEEVDLMEERDMESDESIEPEVETISGVYQDYSEENLQTALSEGKRVVLSFHADWCPTCRAFESELIQNIDQLPSDVVVLKTNFDTETELKDKYTVVAQHTFVYLDNAGEKVNSIIGGNLAVFLNNLQ